MSIVAIGIDLCSISHIEGVIERNGTRFLDRCFTPQEQAECGTGATMPKSYAIRFAAKEACMKAFGLGWAGGMRFIDIWVSHNERGAPSLNLAGFAAEYAEKLGVTSIHVSLSHERDMAVAVVILEGAAGSNDE